MSDQALPIVSTPDYNKQQIKTTPTYWILVECGKKILNFLAIKYDETPGYIKCVGFYLSKTDDIEAVLTNYTQYINDKAGNYIEVSFPHSRVMFIQNLIYKNKALK